ncbi:MAG: glycoside hydrolase family 43 protein [Lysobacteraceae bacterium]
MRIHSFWLTWCLSWLFLLSAPTALAQPQSTNGIARVVINNCGDPAVLRVSAYDYVATCSTNGADDSVAIYRSSDLVNWYEAGRGLQGPAYRPQWVLRDQYGNYNYWAPEIHRVGGRYVMYFTGRYKAFVAGKDTGLCIGAAWSTSPVGPFNDIGHCLISNTTEPMGLIDPTHFEDTDGRHYLLFKRDGNAVKKQTAIVVTELTSDGLSEKPGSARTQLIVNDRGTWEGPLVEAPWLIKRNGTYYLFYGGNAGANVYSTGVAKSSSIRGPFTKRGARILKPDAVWDGLGHATVVTGPNGQEYILSQIWRTGAWIGGMLTEARYTELQPLVWTDVNGKPSVWPRALY